MSVLLFVRIRSDLSLDEIERRISERKPHFLKIPGLIQKAFGYDPATGNVCGIYFFENQEALDAYRETELAKTIPEAYEAVDVRREVFEVLCLLRPEKGPAK